ncbi:MAG: glyoxylase-like metal-dependent hydrolase (beta-lactamase superfamily II) [Yoonia sp.]|jgi:glyoxylase-like metal-dependent hydrolase (beta-lactamase superfamily II)
MITRRKLIQSVPAGLVAAALPLPVWSATTMALGSMQIDVLSDGNLVLPGRTNVDDMHADELSKILQKYDISSDQRTPDCNVTLIRDGDRVILIDVGSGSEFMASAGRLQDALAAIDVDPYDVTHVVFTHAHPDHLWGLLDDFEDLTFPNATYMIGKSEWNYWIDPETVDTIGDARTTFAVGARRRLALIEDNITFFNDGEEILPGIAARATFGHTPGHMAFHIAQGSNNLMVLGDCVGNHHVAFERPEWRAGSDQDGDLGAATRAALLDQLASEHMSIIGYHMPYPGIGRAEKRADGYIFVTEE